MPTSSKSRAMPSFNAAPNALVKAFEHLAQMVPQATSRKVFGYPALFINGQMFAGLHQDKMILRLPEEDRTRFMQLKGASVFEPMPGRPMREYVVVPPSLIKSDAALQVWLDKALAYASTLPPKAAKPKARRTKA
jgi:TfoX/Sxy family transcriptional regulator of competence genes